MSELFFVFQESEEEENPMALNRHLGKGIINPFLIKDIRRAFVLKKDGYRVFTFPNFEEVSRFTASLTPDGQDYSYCTE